MRRYRRKAALALSVLLSLAISVSAAAQTGHVTLTGNYVIQPGNNINMGPGARIATETPQGTQPEELFGGGQLAMLTSQSDSQMLSCLLQSAEGGLVVVDGGCEEDSDYLLQAIADRGGHVNAWLLTHADADHVGALYNILDRESLGGITVDHVYCSLGEQKWYDVHTAGMASFVRILRERLGRLPQETVVDPVTAGMEILVPGVRTVVLNDAEYGNSNTANGAGIVYRCEMNGVRIMFLGDLDERGGERLLRQTAPEELRADIVQMAHHGQNGTGREVYEAIGARICLWPTPDWLWNNDRGNGLNSASFSTLETRRWMRELGVRQNYVTKDGDIILR